jgi:hypothetical protein
MKKKTIFVILTVIILLSVPTTADIVQKANIENSNIKTNEIYIQEDIYLNRIDAIFLDRALKQFYRAPLFLDTSGYNKKIRDLIRDIINHIEVHGYIDGVKISDFLENKHSDTNITHVFGRPRFQSLFIRTDGSSEGSAWVFPTLRSFFTLGLYFPFGKLIYYYPTWNYETKPEWNMLINHEPIPFGRGLLFGYSGYVFNAVRGSGDDSECIFQLEGWGILIFHESWEEQ